MSGVASKPEEFECSALDNRGLIQTTRVLRQAHFRTRPVLCSGIC